MSDEEEYIETAGNQDKRGGETVSQPAEDEPAPAGSRKRKRPQKQTFETFPPLTSIPASLVDYILTKLQEVDDVGETLLQLARLFREQSALCLQQATRLDRMAEENEKSEGSEYIENVSDESHTTRLHRQSVVYFTEKSADMMLQCQEKLDSIESRLVPWDQEMEESQKLNVKCQKGSLRAYNLFAADRFNSVAERLGTKDTKLVLSALGKEWRALSDEEKELYHERLREILKERAKAANENDKQTDNDEKAHSG